MNKRVASFESKKKSMETEMTVIPTLSAFGITKDFYSNCMDYEDLRALCQQMDKAVRETVKDANLKNVTFFMGEESFNTLINSLDIIAMSLMTVPIEYYGYKLNQNEVVSNRYVVAISISDLDIVASIYEITSDGLIIFNYETREWEPDKTATEIYNFGCSENKDAEAALDFFFEAADQTGIHPFMLNDKALKSYKNNMPLINLHKRLMNLTAFDFNYYPDESGEFMPFLIPDDFDRLGGAVYWKDGKYHICQYFRPEDASEAVMAGIDDYNNDQDYEDFDDYDLYEPLCGSLDDKNVLEKENDDIIQFPDHGWADEEELAEDNELDDEPCIITDVYTTSDIKEASHILRFFWDHYSSGDEVVFTFPLSATAYAESKNPYDDGFEIITQNGERTLTPEEQTHLNNLKDYFVLIDEEE